MKIKKNGFTLVELLAVIVILAIILVIAVPQIMNVIKDTTKASLESSAKMVAAQVENQYTVAQTLGKNFSESGSCMEEWAGLNDTDYESCTYKVDTNGNVKVTIGGKGKFEGLSVCNGTRNSATAVEGDVCLPKTLSRVAVISTDLGVTSVHSCATSGTCEPGTPFAIKVSDTETYKFYVISDDGTEVTLIMSENLGKPVEWISEEDYDKANADDNTECDDNACTDEGPITALNELNERTKDWNNLDSFNYTLVNNEGNGDGGCKEYTYNSIDINNVKVRMVTHLEIDVLTMAGGSYKFPDYLKPNNWNEYYWSSTMYTCNLYCPYYVNGDGIDNLDGDQCVLNGKYGLRPVIEVKK